MAGNPARTKKKEINPQRKAELLLSIKKKRECEAKALRVVHLLLENPVSQDVLLANAFHISQSHYQDVVEERIINKNCGYALCLNPLKSVPKQKYKIDTSTNKVYDISDRKNFCSPTCYKASNFFKDQLLTSPLWLRGKEAVPKFTVFEAESCSRELGTVVDFKVPTPEAPPPPPKFEVVFPSNNSPSKLTTHFKNLTLKDPRPKLPPAPPTLSTLETTERALTQWLCVESFIFLWGEDKTFSKAQEAGKPLLPNYSNSDSYATQDYSKVEAFFRGSLEYEAVKDEEAAKQTEESQALFFLPISEGKIGNQMTYRRRIVLAGLHKALGELGRVLEFVPSKLTSDLGELVHTYQLTADTLMFKPAEWNLIALIHLHMLRQRIPHLDQILCSPNAEKFTDLFLNNLHLSPEYLNQLMEEVWTTTLHK